MLRATALFELCRRQTLHIGDDELIVGERGPRPKGASTYPEVTCHSLEDLVANLAPPRRVMVMVKAGAAVDAVIGDADPALEADREEQVDRQRLGRGLGHGEVRARQGRPEPEREGEHDRRNQVLCGKRENLVHVAALFPIRQISDRLSAQRVLGKEKRPARLRRLIRRAVSDRNELVVLGAVMLDFALAQVPGSGLDVLKRHPDIFRHLINR